MKSFVVMTYYQLMHSVAMALDLDEKPILYFNRHYLNIQEDLLERIRETGVFSRVVGITGRGELNPFISDLNKTKDFSPEEVEETGSSVFEEHLEPYYSGLFSDADKGDTIYVYNDFQWEYYYIHKHFDHIIGIEDGYASLPQQLKIHKFKGNHQLVEKFLGKYYPEPLYRAPKVEMIISSKAFDDLPDEYFGKLKIMDFNDIVRAHQAEFRDAMFHIFDIDDFEIEDNSVLFLAQPLSRAKYCLSLEEYLLNRKILRDEEAKGRTVYYKAHPADRTDPQVYEKGNIHVLPKSFPVELLNHMNCSFEKVLSFGSTSVDTLNCAKRFEKIYGRQDAVNEEITAFIRETIRNEKVSLKICFLVRSLDPDTYINVYSGMFTKHSYLRPEPVVLARPDMAAEAEQFFDKKDLNKRITEYKEKHSVRGVSLWGDELDDLAGDPDRISAPAILSCDDITDDRRVLSSIDEIPGEYDYIMIVDQNTVMFPVMNSLYKEIEFRFRSLITYQNYTEIPDKKLDFPWTSLSPGFIDSVFTGELINKVWHRSLFTKIRDLPEAERILTISEFGSKARKYSDDLYISSERFTSTADGLRVYSDRANDCFTSSAEIPQDVREVQAAQEVYDYMTWRKITDQKYDAASLHEMMNEIAVDPVTKAGILEKLCATLLYEKDKRFSRSFSEDRETGRYISKKNKSSRNGSPMKNLAKRFLGGR